MAAPITALDEIIVGGPCKITDPNTVGGTTVFYTETDVRLEPQTGWRHIPSDVGGDHDSVLADLFWRVSFTPKSYYAYHSALVPVAYVNWATSGVRIVGSANRTVTILGSDGQQYALTRAALTRMPDFYMGLGKSMWGGCEYTAFIGQGKKTTDSDAFMVPTSGQTWSQTDYSAIAAAQQESLCNGAWGSVAGFTNVFAEEGFQFTHEFRATPIKQGNITVDQKIESYRVMVTFRPQQPTEAQILAAAQFGEGATLGIGTRMTSNALANSNDFVVTDGVVTVTAKTCAFQKGQFIFDNKLNRLGEWGLITALTNPGTRLTFA